MSVPGQQFFPTSSPGQLQQSQAGRSYTLLGFPPRFAVLPPKAFAWQLRKTGDTCLMQSESGSMLG